MDGLTRMGYGVEREHRWLAAAVLASVGLHLAGVLLFPRPMPRAAPAVRPPTDVIDKREALRANPPDVLLTNYKMLDFLLQELNREANTTLSKSTDMAIKEAALAIKAEVEKLREQVQNVE